MLQEKRNKTLSINYKIVFWLFDDLTVETYFILYHGSNGVLEVSLFCVVHVNTISFGGNCGL